MSPVTIVTGGSRGIGAAAVRRLAADGHAVCLSFRENSDAAEKVVREVVDAGGRCVAVRADVSREDDTEVLFRTAREELGQITGLVANAGVTSPMMPLADQPVSQLRHVIEVNVLGALLSARRAVQSMSTARGGNGGSIVFISSSAPIHGGPGEYVHYAASKGAVDVLTVGLAKEVAKEGIRVNTVAPGMVDTEIHVVSGDPERAWNVAGRIPMARPGDPAEIANAVSWLMSEQASYATGAVFRIAGGL
ncbi:SDR family oxidoreductase [Kutzneria sp. CA-103260]|uniref:SDR family oxidoreductase n=1 Tax=Kutzneria sp. CA-103260 TaxID=2802641 RepID=UPI001BAD7AA0|nr:SDR family oxidoreductase [Kutzneria sp. CA-103260]QUQ66304.1 oxidoreductase [Kutzneria sp. CA-103260]